MDEKQTSSISSKVPEVSGYIQAVSPVKKATHSQTKYFNCNIQTNEKVVRAVCFNPDRKPHLEKLQKGQTAVRLSNIRSSVRDGVESIIIQNNTTVQPVVLQFGYKDVSTTSSLPSLASLQDVSLEQLVEVKAKVTNIAGVKTQNTRYGHALQKQEVILVDHTTSIKLVLWEQHCDKLENGKTYILKNLRLKESNNTRYLNTPKSEDFEFKETNPFTQDLAAVITDLESLSQNKIVAKLIGMHSASKSLSCTSCKKKVTVKSNGKIATCQSCKIMQKVSSCIPQWVLKVLFQNVENNNEKLAIVLFHQEVSKLSALSSDINLNTISEEEMVCCLLEIESDLCITFDTATNKLIDVSLLDI